MSEFEVTLPVAGSVVLFVKADSEKDAIEKALEMQWEPEDLQELESHEHICEGNVMMVWTPDASAEEIKESK